MLSISASRIQTPTHPPTPIHTYTYPHTPTHTCIHADRCTPTYRSTSYISPFLVFSQDSLLCLMDRGLGERGGLVSLGVFSFLVRNCDGGGGHLPVSHGPLRAEWEGICVPSIRCVATPGCVGLLTTPPLH